MIEILPGLSVVILGGVAFCFLHRYYATMLIATVSILPVWFSPSVPGLGSPYPAVYLCAATILMVTVARPWVWSSLLQDGSKALVPVVFLVSGITVAYLSGFSGLAKTNIFMWLLFFLVGYSISKSQECSRQVLRAIQFSGIALAALAIAERFTNTPIGLLFPVLDLGQIALSNYQSRGGSLRAEVTWGHPIALGGLLAGALYLHLAAAPTKHPFRRHIGSAILLLGVFCTGSRASYACAAVAMLLALFWSQRATGVSRLSVVMGMTSALVALPWLASGSSDSASADYAASNAYRFALLREASRNLGLFGPAPGYSINHGAISFRGFRFLDNVLVQTMVAFGVVVTLSLIVLMFQTIIRCASAPGDKFQGLVVTQLPALMVMGFLGQHQSFFWLMVGAAVPLGASKIAETRGARSLRGRVGV